MLDIGYAGALLGGVATLLSPCAAMLLPAFFAYAFTSRRTLIGRTGLFYLGMLTTLVPLGVAASSAGVFLTEHRTLLITITGWTVIVMGVLQALAVPLPLPGVKRSAATSPLAVYLLGTTYGLAGVCSGPILGSLLAVAAFGGEPVKGGVLMALYAAGMVLPLLVLAMAWDAGNLSRASWLRPRPVQLGPVRTTVVQLVSGVLFIGLGVLLLRTDGTTALGGLLSPARQIELEAWLRDRASGISDILVIGAVLAIAGLAWWIADRRSRRSRR